MVLPKIHNLKFSWDHIRKKQIEVSPTKLPIIFKIIKVKIKGNFEELPVKEIKVLWQSNAMYGCEFDSFLQKNIIGTIVETWLVV